MLVRLVKEARIGVETRSAGELWDLPTDEAIVLMEDGLAVPVSRDVLEKETR